MAPAGAAGHRPAGGQLDGAQPAVRRGVHLPRAQQLPADTKLVLTITDEAGRQVRRMDLDKAAGMRRVVWNLRGDPPATTPAQGSAPQPGAGGRGGFQQAPLATPGRYHAVLGKQVGDTVTPIGPPQTFHVIQVQQ